MIQFVVGSYQFFELAGGGNQPVRIYLNDENGIYRGYLEFKKDLPSTTKFVVHSTGKINVYMPLEKLQVTLDVLRKEKPVYLAVNQTYNWAALKTGAEPTGEEESSQ